MTEGRPASILALDANGNLIALEESSYISEDVLQRYLEDHPELIPGDQVNRGVPRRWLLIGREVPVPDRVDGKERWALDHLLLDQDATPTFVEVKRSSDTRIRREVVGQMLDYAANAKLYWSVGAMREAFAATCARRGINERAILEQFLAADEASAESAIEEFWIQAARNLSSGKVRLVFFADAIPPELQRIIEFLNDQMTTTEVLGVEVRKYTSEALTAFVPRVLGVTSEAQDVKNSAARGAAGDVVPTLLRAGIIPTGAELRFEPTTRRESVGEYFRKHPNEALAYWHNEETWEPLRWALDGQRYSCTGLARKLYVRAGEDVPTIRGPRNWTYQGQTLVDLAATFSE